MKNPNTQNYKRIHGTNNSENGSSSYIYGASNLVNSPSKTPNKRSKLEPELKKDIQQTALFLLVGFLIAKAVIGSTLLALPFAAASGYLPLFFTQRKKEKDQLALALLWPEIIDHVISGLRSGLSLAETLIQLSVRGPEKSREIFLGCEELLRSRGDFPAVFTHIKEQFGDHIADQVCEVLDFARMSGSRDITTILRTLGDHIRADIAIKAEIRAKHGWIKNSAVIATLAPWILLLILSAQPVTIRAFSTGTGIFVLILGILLSVVAFLWMAKVGKIEDPPRIFGAKPVLRNLQTFQVQPRLNGGQGAE